MQSAPFDSLSTSPVARTGNSCHRTWVAVLVWQVTSAKPVTKARGHSYHVKDVSPSKMEDTCRKSWARFLLHPALGPRLQTREQSQKAGSRTDHSSPDPCSACDHFCDNPGKKKKRHQLPARQAKEGTGQIKPDPK